MNFSPTVYNMYNGDRNKFRRDLSPLVQEVSSFLFRTLFYLVRQQILLIGVLVGLGGTTLL